MVTSMTAFSRQSSQVDGIMLVWELRTVNHRFLDLSIRLPEACRQLESAVRQLLSKKLQRGKVEATLKAVGGAGASIRYHFNETLVEQLAQQADKAHKYFPQSQLDLAAILAWPGVLEMEAADFATPQAAILELLLKTTDDLVQMRRREGSEIGLFIQERIQNILKLLTTIAEQIPQLLAAERKRIQVRIAELNLESDSQRLEQEMALLIQKTDVAEEIQRLNSHCQALQQALTQPGAIGRRLDFLSQELHREANTLSNKALSVNLIQVSIEMKVLIEQIREQVQNIE